MTATIQYEPKRLQSLAAHLEHTLREAAEPLRAALETLEALGEAMDEWGDGRLNSVFSEDSREHAESCILYLVSDAVVSANILQEVLNKD